MATATELNVERVQLDATSWVDIVRGLVADADQVHDELVAGVAWQQGRVFRYERWIPEPRLTRWVPASGPFPHPVLLDAHRALRHRYRITVDGVALSWYRDGNDSVAIHRDRELRHLDDTIVVVLTFGARRPFLVQRRSSRHEEPGAAGAIDLSPGSGDLLVMGGRCQADWLHLVPKVRGLRRGRISAQWRWTSRRGRPEMGANYRAPRTFSR